MIDVTVQEPMLSVTFKFVDGRVLERDIRPDVADDILPYKYIIV